MRNISTQSSPAVRPTSANSQNDLLQPGSDASAASIIAATGSFSTSFLSKRTNECPSNAGNKISVSTPEAVESESMELDNDDASHHQDAPSNIDPASPVDFCNSYSGISGCPNHQYSIL